MNNSANIASNMVQIQNNTNAIKSSLCPEGTCSNRGTCDVSTGACVCESGFERDMCQGKSLFQFTTEGQNKKILSVVNDFEKKVPPA